MALDLAVTDLRGYLDQVPEEAAQRLTITGAPTGGTYTLAYAGQTTTATAPNATAATVQAALTTVTATASDSDPIRVYGAAGGPYLVVWRPQSARTASAITLATNSLIGGTDPSVTVVQDLDAVLQDVLTRAESIVEAALLPVAFAAYGSATTRDVRTQRAPSIYLRLPAHQTGSVSAVAEIPQHGALAQDETPLTGWSEYDRHLVRSAGWAGHAWYRVTAVWGYGPATADAQQLALEIAVNIWRSKDRGLYSEYQGVEGGGEIRYIGGLNSMQRQIIENIRRQHREIIL